MTTSCAWSVTTAAQRRPRGTGPRHGQCVHVVEVCTIVAAEQDRCAISKRRHCVRISCAWSVTTAAQRRPRGTGPRHGQCEHFVDVCTIPAAEEDRCAISKRRHCVRIPSAWRVTTAAQRRPRGTRPRHGQCVHVVTVCTIGAAEQDHCVISKRRHCVTPSSAWSVTTAAQRRPRGTGPRHGQCVHVVEVFTIPAAEQDRCAISKRRHCVPISFDGNVTIAAQRLPRGTGPRHGQCVHVVEVCTTIVAAEQDRCAISKQGHCVNISFDGNVTIAAQRLPTHRRP